MAYSLLLTAAVVILATALLKGPMASFLSRQTTVAGLGQLWTSPGRPGRLTTALAAVLGPLVFSSPFSGRARYCLRMVAFVLGIGIGSLTGVLAGLTVPLVRPSWRKNIQWLVGRTFYGLVGPIIGWRFIVEGEEHLEGCYRGEPHVLVGNHQSMIDLLYLGRIFPKTCVVMAKKELKYVPLLGQYMSLSRAVFVDRHNRNTALETFQKVGSDMKTHGLSLFLFPEGTRSNASTPSLLPFKKGAFHLAIQAGLPLVPVVCETYAGLYASRAARFEPGNVLLKVLEPVVPQPGQSVEELCELVREKMLKCLVEISQRPGSASSALGNQTRK